MAAGAAAGAATALRIQLHCGRPFLPEDLEGAALGGTEQAVLHLAGALARRGAAVSVGGATTRARRLAGVAWVPALDRPGDMDVAVNDARLLPRAARVAAVWFHNEVTLLRELRRGRLPALLRRRPIGVFLGRTQEAGARWMPYRARLHIPHGLTSAYLAAVPASVPPPPVALFASQAYRGLDDLMALWRDAIGPAVPEARFEARIAAAELAAWSDAAPAGVAILPRLPNAAMPDRLRRARVLLAPGHAAETFCLAAAEAVALGVPVITRGWGALAERVRDGQTGYVCRSWEEFAARVRAVLTDDGLWRRLHMGCLAAPRSSWDDLAARWLALGGG